MIKWSSFWTFVMKETNTSQYLIIVSILEFYKVSILSNNFIFIYLNLGATIESLLEKLNQRPQSIFQVWDELATFSDSFGLYKPGLFITILIRCRGLLKNIYF